MTGSVIKPQWHARTGVSRSCVHTRLRDGSVRHQHGTYNRWLLDRCRCGACTVAGSRRSKAYRLGLRPVVSPMVPASRVAEHIEALHRAGLSHADIAEAAGKSRGSIRRYAYLKDGECRFESVKAILAIPARREAVLAAAGYVDATATIRRLRALAVIGWPAGVTADRMGLSRDTVTDLRMGHLQRVRSATAAVVAAHYRRMVVEPPSGATRSQVSEARTGATRRGWVGPMAWDSVTIADPHACPFAGFGEKTA